ncbi:relaxase/mobilization nuclease domain-containing protein [Pseudomonas aeruginosa]|uniref:relaxase/mobilization nuclease domain-containing protein n=1 Tax=Pseudomonas aeruginosa TaxID=287 RepID=UPI001F2CDCC4|nr:relaxase/mobilization nuclease domain-containing protein [Pseudomonas aeruginosa]MDP5420892.1 relaxase/mobilization nuclease domain-containing protein [Pseudomonas aeruginosa]UJC26758.1 relaxase/mobilization nuclease domain-containing protein [Pseudomonas aeruginosa]HCF1796921.1 relaxase/mobilization nuclease domain-containing protein [Pseudomonas aeruginosa]
MIREKLSTQKSKIETQNTLAYTIKKAILVESNRCQRGTNQEFIEFLAKKFDMACTGKQENTSFHETLSFHTSDNITPEKALEIAKELYSDTIGLNREHSFAVHNDTDELHIHFIWAPKDFNNEMYYQKNDYRIIEKKLAELEIKHNLYQVENRKALKPDLETQPRKSKKEQALEQRGIETIKSQFKKDVSSALDKSRTTTNFFGYLHDKGYDIIPNGKTAYSISKNGNTLKSSAVGGSYASLKKRLEEQHDFAELLEHYRKKEKEEVDAHISTNAKVDYLTKNKHQTTLAKHFSPVFEDDKVEYYYKKSSNKKAFDYYKEPSKVSFNDLSSKTLRAGLQRLTQDMPKPGPLYCSGSDNARKRIWLEFKMMDLEAQGFTMNGYKPTADDLKELEKRKADFAEQQKEWKKAPEAPIQPVAVIPEPNPPEEPEPPQNVPQPQPEPPKRRRRNAYCP